MKNEQKLDIKCYSLSELVNNITNYPKGFINTTDLKQYLKDIQIKYQTMFGRGETPTKETKLIKIPDIDTKLFWIIKKPNNE